MLQSTTLSRPCDQANENAQQWEKRAQQLQQKYGKVDLAEHQRVQQKLAKAEAELAEHRSTTDSSTRSLRAELEKVRLWLALLACATGIGKFFHSI